MGESFFCSEGTHRMPRKKKKTIAIDTETTGLHPHHGCRPFMVSACTDEGDTYYWEFEVDTNTRIPIFTPNKVRDLVRTLNSFSTWVFHNAKFDMSMLSYVNGFFSKETYHQKDIHDTLLQSHIFDPKQTHALKALAILHLNMLDDDEQALKQAVQKARTATKKLGWKTAKESPEQLPSSGSLYLCDYWLPKAAAVALEYEADHEWHTVCSNYAVMDVERTIGLYLLFSDYLRKNNLWHVYDDHRKLIPVLTTMESYGLGYRKDKAKDVLTGLSKQQEQLTKQLSTMGEREGLEKYNPNSGVQLQKLLYDIWDCPIVKNTDKGRPSTDASALSELVQIVSGPAEEYIKAHQDRSKITTNIRYIEGYERFAICRNDHCFLHPNINQCGTSTTRCSSSNPNGQNVGKGEDEVADDGHVERKFNLRELFGPPPGHVWYVIDYSSLQLIIFAYESNSQGLIEIFKAGGDPHNYVAQGIFGVEEPTELQRRIAKNVNYGLIFGAGEWKIDQTAGKQGTYRDYLDQFPDSARYMSEVIRAVKRTGQVHTAWGYPLTVEDHLAYKGVNYIIQGDEGEIVKRAMILCHNYLEYEDPNARLDFRAKMVMQVHDELIFECPEDYPFNLDKIIELMMQPAAEKDWHTPVDASLVTEHWGSKQKVTQDDIVPF